LIVDEYGPTIQYVKGCKNVVADFLSRQPRSSALPVGDEAYFADAEDDSFPLSFDVISFSQQSDPALVTIVESNPAAYMTRMVNRSPLIYFKDKIVIPKALQLRILQWYHDTLLHPGTTRTYETIHQHFTWQNLAQDVQQYCSTCATCQEQKKSTRKYGLLPTKTHDPKPWYDVAVDLMGPWTLPSSGHIKPPLLVLSIMDMATNFLESIALPDKTARTVAISFDRTWLCRYPRPINCVSTTRARNSPDLSFKSYYSRMVLRQMLRQLITHRPTVFSSVRIKQLRTNYGHKTSPQWN
jgi:hypothetical protein